MSDDRDTPYDSDRHEQEKEVRRYSHTCSYCGEPHIIPRREQSHYWAENIEERLNRLWVELDRVIADLQEMFPSVPIEEYLDARCQRLRRGVNLSRKALDSDLSLEEECELQNILEEFQPEDPDSHE